MSTPRSRPVSKRTFVIVTAITFGLVLAWAIAVGPRTWRAVQLVKASDDVLGQIEQMFVAYGFVKTDQYCEELGAFQQGEYYFRCSMSAGSSHAPDRSSTTRKAFVIVYNDKDSAERGSGTGAIHGQERLLLSVPYLPSTSTVWQDDWAAVARPGI